MTDHHLLLQQIAAYNNSGADLFLAGDIEGSIGMFTRALRSSKHAQLSSGSDTPMSQMEASNLDEELIDFNSFAILEREDNFDCIARPGDHENEHQGPSIFHQALRVMSNSAALRGLESVELLSTITIFNLALAIHESAAGMTCKDENSGLKTALGKAIHLYELAFNLIRSSEAMTSSNCFLHMAILNNLTHAHALLGNGPMSEQCSTQLLSTLMLVVDSTSRGFQQQVLTYGIFGFFFQSTSPLIFAAGSPSAAAA